MSGEGEGKEGTASRKPHDFEKLRSPTNAASDWCGASSVNLQTNPTVKYQGAFFRIVGFAGKRFLFSSPPPPSTFFFFASALTFAQ